MIVDGLFVDFGEIKGGVLAIWGVAGRIVYS